MTDRELLEAAAPIAWVCTRRTTGDKRVFDKPFVATNPDYVRVHKDHDWRAVSTKEQLAAALAKAPTP